MSIIQIDQRPIPKSLLSTPRLTWQQKFRRNLYQNNYARTIQNINSNEDVELQDRKNQGIKALTDFIQQSKDKKLTSLFQLKREFYDAQLIQPYYSPYSVFIPMEGQSYMNDEIVNTFSYISHLCDTAKRIEVDKNYILIHDYFKGGKQRGQDYVQQQWMKVKNKYICQLDVIKCAALFIQLTRKNSKLVDQLYKLYGKGCIKQVFFYRVTRTSMYIRSSVKMHKNLQISMEVGIQINQKTLPLTMKTWYCALCMAYDCEKHKLESKVIQYKYEYISEKNRKSQCQHIQQIIKLLRGYEYIRQESSMSDIQERIQALTCSEECYKKLKKADILKLNNVRHKLISPLAKSLLKLGIQMFSYNPCQIHYLFQSSEDKTNINCNLIFLHFVEECNLINLINMKMNKFQVEFLQNQDSKFYIANAKIPLNKPKIKKTTYMEKRQKNQNPEFAVCMHNFIGHPTIDPKCEECVCRERGFCLPTCLCGEGCTIMRIGCSCKNEDMCQNEKCICFTNNLQCQPGVCSECFHGKHGLKKTNCRNVQILKQKYRRAIVGVSQIQGAGLGAFAGENFSKNDLVCKYSGEHIASDVDFIREMMIKDLSFYNFDSPNGKTVSASIDARFLGNKARFINHGNEGEQNLRCQTVCSNGTQYIALYAARDIKQGEELTFNYDGNGTLYAQHRDKYPFIKAPIRKKD